MRSSLRSSRVNHCRDPFNQRAEGLRRGGDHMDCWIAGVLNYPFRAADEERHD
jgi:hypothetical protein